MILSLMKMMMMMVMMRDDMMVIAVEVELMRLVVLMLFLCQWRLDRNVRQQSVVCGKVWKCGKLTRNRCQ